MKITRNAALPAQNSGLTPALATYGFLLAYTADRNRTFRSGRFGLRRFGHGTFPSGDISVTT